MSRRNTLEAKRTRRIDRELRHADAEHAREFRYVALAIQMILNLLGTTFSERPPRRVLRGRVTHERNRW